MVIYALFACWQVAATGDIYCTMQRSLPGVFDNSFASLKECQRFALQFHPHSAFAEDGRLWIDVETRQWLECRHRHVDTWEPQ